jgi:hypothetical protein
MTNHDHERAIDLITRRGIEDVAPSDLAWLEAHLSTCDDCTRYADAFGHTGQLLRSVSITASPTLVAATQHRVRARALYLQEQRSRMVLIAISLCIGALSSTLTSWLWWHFGGWIAQRLGMSPAIVQPGIFVASTVPAVLISVAMLASSRPVIDRSLIMAGLAGQQEGARQ